MYFIGVGFFSILVLLNVYVCGLLLQLLLISIVFWFNGGSEYGCLGIIVYSWKF